MGVLRAGNNYQDGDQVTGGNLNNHVNDAVFTSNAVDNNSTQLSAGAIIVKDGGITSQKIDDKAVTADKLADGTLENLYPVGSVYINASTSTNPATLFGFGTWVAFGKGRVLVGLDSADADFNTAEITGGAKTHTLKQSEMPAHTHNVQVTQRVTGDDAAGGSRVLTANRNITTGTIDITGMTAKSTGGGQSHNNLQPYITVYMWKRTA